jgi:transportin-3
MTDYAKIQEALAMMSSNSPDKTQALHYLENFQKTPDAWNAAHTVLQGAQYPMEMKMFAAQTLRNKMTYDLHQIPQEALSGLKDSVIGLLIQYSDMNKPIRTQLCVALAKLSIQYLSWNNTLEEIITALQQNIPTLLEFLKILPEESLDAKGTPLTDEEFRLRTNELIVANVEKVLLLLSNYSQSSGDNSQASALILDCLNSWIREIPVEQLLQVQPLTNIIFSSLQNEESFERAIECLCTIITETRDVDNQQLIYALYEQVIQLRPLLQQHKDDPDVFGSLTRLFVEAGEAWHALIAKHPLTYKPLVEIILECTAYDEDLDIVKYTFYFWYSLKLMVTLDRYSEARQEFIPIYTQLLHVMIKHLHYPDGSENEPLFSNKEEEEKFKDFRYEMGDVLKDCTAVIGASDALIIPFQQIQSFLSAPIVKWQDVEAPLFSLRAMAKEVSLKENKVLPQIMELLVQLPENSKIRYAATLVLGRYTEWTSRHPEYLERQLNYIINGFQFSNSDIVTAASHALMYFCQDCSKLLSGYIEQLYAFYINILGSPAIDVTSLYEITEGIAYIIDKQDASNVANATTMFIKPVMEKLSKYSETLGSEEVYKDIAEEIEIVRIYFEVIKPRSFQAQSDPIASLVTEIWPLVVSLLEKHGQSTKVSERCMKFTKTILQTYSFFLTNLLPSIANVLVKGFESTRFGCYLWVSGVVIREFGDESSPQETKEAVWNFAYQQITTFLTVFKQVQPIDIPDLIDDFFRMMSDVIMFFVVQFVLSDILKPTYDASLLALDLEKTEPLVTTLHFLIDLVSWGFDTPPISIYEDVPPEVKLTVQSFIAENGGTLIKCLLNGLIFKFSQDAQADASDVLGKTIRLAPSPDTAVMWLNSAIDSLPHDSVSMQERSKLLTTVSSALGSKDYRRIRVSLKDFVTWYSRKNITPRFQA